MTKQSDQAQLLIWASDLKTLISVSLESSHKTTDFVIQCGVHLAD